MKKQIFIAAFAVTLLGGSVLQSCNKISDAIDPFTFSQTEEFTFEPITTIEDYVNSGTHTAEINLDQIIKDNTGSSFGLKNIQSVVLKKITLTVLNADEANNITNFETFDGYINSDAGRQSGLDDIHMSASIPDGPFTPDNQTLEINGDPNMNLADYLKGNSVEYWFRTKARRTTDKEMKVSMKVEYTVKIKL